MTRTAADRNEAILSANFRRLVLTGFDNQTAATQARDRGAWQRIKDTLEGWRRNPAQLADDGLDPPTLTVIRIAFDVLDRLEEQGYHAPDRIVPDPNGGIEFEAQHDDGLVETVHVWGNGEVEYMQFIGSRLVHREPF